MSVIDEKMTENESVKIEELNSLNRVSLPIEGLDNPTICTSDNEIELEIEFAEKLTVTVPEGISICMGKRSMDGDNLGDNVTVVTQLSEFSGLPENTTFYFRGNVNPETGLLEIYAAKGKPTDETPEGMTGGESGGGYDSNPLDILLAKVTTTEIGVAPTVIKFVNRRLLAFSYTGDFNTVVSHHKWLLGQSVPMNFARTPLVKVALVGYLTNENVVAGTTVYQPPQKLSTVKAENTTKESTDIVYLQGNWNNRNGVSFTYTLEAIAE